MSDIISHCRKISVEDLLLTKTLKKVWPIWKIQISQLIGTPADVDATIGLGDHLGNIFGSTSKIGRTQSTLKSGGIAWEGIVGWYLNLCLMGSRTVVLRMKKTMVPEPIRNAITVMYGNFASNTESDLLAITFPKRKEYRTNISDQDSTPQNFKKLLDEHARLHFPEYEVGIIQCKTNWNDNAQIPMLWDMVYSAQGFGQRNISVGTKGYSIGGLKKFTYSFVTVPTQKNIIKPDSTPVMRVYNLSGGNYWGKPIQRGVASSIQEIFQKNFSGGFDSDLRSDLLKELPKLYSEYKFFGL